MLLSGDFCLQHLRFHLEPKAPLHMPTHNKGNVIRGGFGSTFRLSARAQAERIVYHRIGNGREATGNSKNRLQAANFGEMPDTWKRSSAFEERTVGGN